MYVLFLSKTSIWILAVLKQIFTSWSHSSSSRERSVVLFLDTVHLLLGRTKYYLNRSGGGMIKHTQMKYFFSRFMFSYPIIWKVVGSRKMSFVMVIQNILICITCSSSCHWNEMVIIHKRKTFSDYHIGKMHIHSGESFDMSSM